MKNHNLKVFTGVQIMMDWTRENLKQNARPALTISMNENGNLIIKSNIPRDLVIELLGNIHDELIRDINVISFSKK